MTYYCTIKTDIAVKRIYTEKGSKYWQLWDNEGNCTTHYGDPEEFINSIKKRSAQLNKSVIIER